MAGIDCGVAIRALSFDLFDTLVDLGLPAGGEVVSSTRALHAAVSEAQPLGYDDFRTVLREVDSELRASHHANGLELSTDKRFAALCARLGVAEPGLPGRLTTIHMDNLRRHTSPVAHHPALLNRWRAALQVGVCSNFSHAPTAHRVIEEASLAEGLDAVVISETVGLRKPRPEIFHALLSALGVRPDETLHIGDNLRADVAGAAAVGCRTVWITRRVPNPAAALERYDGPPPDFVVADLAELDFLISA